jgi:hypothetical protein
MTVPSFASVNTDDLRRVVHDPKPESLITTVEDEVMEDEMSPELRHDVSLQMENIKAFVFILFIVALLSYSASHTFFTLTGV